MTKTEIRNSLIKAGVKNLKEFGYPDVNSDNILTDEVYSEFFKSMLKENKGYGEKIDSAIDELLNEINKNNDNKKG